MVHRTFTVDTCTFLGTFRAVTNIVFSTSLEVYMIILAVGRWAAPVLWNESVAECSPGGVCACSTWCPVPDLVMHASISDCSESHARSDDSVLGITLS